MTSRQYQPTGYCPKCGYPLDPGRCPECGATVAPDQILSEPLHVHRRRRFRRRVLVALVAVVATVIGGRFLYRAVNWVSLAPTSVLFVFQGDGKHPATIELFRRYDNGELDAQQVKRMFDGAVGTPRLALRPSAPEDVAFRDTFYPDLRIPGGTMAHNWVTFAHKLALTIDGDLVADGRAWRISWAGGSVVIEVRIPPLPAGQHHVALECALSLVRDIATDRRSAKIQILHTWNLAASADVVVEDHPVAAPSESAP